MDYSSAIVPRTQRLTRGIYSTPSYPKKNKITLHP